jgi:acetylornithine deacetylase/succinyl-diaminopimelate desuccinylase-like protein
MLEATREAASDAALARECSVAEEEIWRIEPLAFDPELVEHARHACREASGAEHELTSGALHDAAEVARVLPAVMVFAPSRAGISHAPEEDTAEDDLAVAIEAFAALAAAALARG